MTNQTGTHIKHFQQSLFQDVIERITYSPDFRNCRQQNQLLPRCSSCILLLLIKSNKDFAQFETKLREDGPIHHDFVVKLPHPIVKVHVINLVTNWQGKHIFAIQGIACCRTGSLTDDVSCGTDVPILLFFDCPHTPFFLAVSVGKIFIKCAGVTLPTAPHIDRHATNNLP
nr:hypothetical protein [uncultured Desulfobulbus sp.]